MRAVDLKHIINNKWPYFGPFFSNFRAARVCEWVGGEGRVTVWSW